MVLVLVAAALAVTTSTAVPARKGCGLRGYGYAGLQSDRRAFGVTATLTALVDPLVERGHVAAWVGVGAPGEGPRATNEWLQIGLNRIAGKKARLYYEVARPSGLRYVELPAKVSPGQRFEVAVLEMAYREDVWRVWVNRRPVSGPIYLPASHGRLTPMAMSENWDGGAPTCNRYKYRFRGVLLARGPGGAWTRFRRTQARVMQDSGYRVLPMQTGGFVAASALPPPQPNQQPEPRPMPSPKPPVSSPIDTAPVAPAWRAPRTWGDPTGDRYHGPGL